MQCELPIEVDESHSFASVPNKKFNGLYRLNIRWNSGSLKFRLVRRSLTESAKDPVLYAHQFEVLNQKDLVKIFSDDRFIELLSYDILLNLPAIAIFTSTSGFQSLLQTEDESVHYLLPVNSLVAFNMHWSHELQLFQVSEIDSFSSPSGSGDDLKARQKGAFRSGAIAEPVFFAGLHPNQVGEIKKARRALDQFLGEVIAPKPQPGKRRHC